MTTETPVKAEVAMQGGQKFNSLSPVTTVSKRLNPFQEGKVLYVHISPNPADGEVYKQGKGLALTKVGLNKLSSAAGLTINCKILSCSKDYVRAEATAECTNAAGIRQNMSGTYEIDMDVIREEIMGRSNGTEAEVLRFQKYKMQRCETGAVNRAIRSILSVRNVYSAQELALPFAVPHVLFSPDFTDPDIKAAAIKKFQGDSGMMYGEDKVQALPQKSETPTALPEASELPQNEEEPKKLDYPEAPKNEQEAPQGEPGEPAEKKTESEESGHVKYDTPPCPKCEGQMTYKEGKRQDGKGMWWASFCKDKDCKEKSERDGKMYGTSKFGKLEPINKDTGEVVPAEAFESEQPDF